MPRTSPPKHQQLAFSNGTPSFRLEESERNSSVLRHVSPIGHPQPPMSKDSLIKRWTLSRARLHLVPHRGYQKGHEVLRATSYSWPSIHAVPRPVRREIHFSSDGCENEGLAPSGWPEEVHPDVLQAEAMSQHRSKCLRRRFRCTTESGLFQYPAKELASPFKMLTRTA
jgi:hypothetical protein